MKITSPFFLFAILIQSVFSQNYSLRSGSSLGSPTSLLPMGASAGQVKSIAPTNDFSGGGGPGKISHGVNLFTGQPNYSVPLGGIGVREVGYAFGLNYSGATAPSYHNDNERDPASWVGFGFNLSFPFVAMNHKGTYASNDDVIFCNLGPYGGGQILIDAASTRYYIASNPYIKVEYVLGTGEFAGQFTQWIFTFPDGKKMAFGQSLNSQRYVLYNNARIYASPNVAVPAKKFVYRWDISSFYDTIPNLSPRNKILFSYKPILDTVTTGTNMKTYVREAYIQDIKWMEGNQEVERYNFITTAKTSAEYVGYASNEPKNDQKLFETQRLDSLKCYHEGILDKFYKFNYTIQSKSLLKSIGVFYPNVSHTGMFQDNGWSFTYGAANQFYLLNSITTPSNKIDTYTYSLMPNLSGSDIGFDPSVYYMKRADNVTDLVIPSDTATLSKWKLENSCDERMCYLVARDGSNMYVEIHRNLGNYFDPRATDGQDEIVKRFEFTGASDWKFVPVGNYFLIYKTGSKGLIRMFEFNGISWIEKYPFANDSRYSSTNGFTYMGNSGAGLDITVAGNYFLAKVSYTPHNIIIPVIHKLNGWTSLNQSEPTACDFDNKAQYDYSDLAGNGLEKTRPDGATSCIDVKNAKVIATSSFFTVLDQTNNILLSYALNKDNSGFTEISKKMQAVTPKFAMIPLQAITSSTSTTCPNNFTYKVYDIFAGPDYFVMLSTGSNSSTTYLHAFAFDGDSLITLVDNVVTGQTIASGVSQIYTSNGYFLTRNSSYFYFWKKKVDANGKLSFAATASIGPNPGGLYASIRTSNQAFTVEDYSKLENVGFRPGGSTDYASYLYQVDPSLTNGFVDKSSLLKINGFKLFNLSISGSDNMISGTSGTNGAGVKCAEDIKVNCNFTYYQGRLQPNNANAFVSGLIDVPAYLSNRAFTPRQEQLTSAARLGAWATLDTLGKNIPYMLLQFNGKGYNNPDSQYVVTRVTSSSNLSTADKDNPAFQFDYCPSGWCNIQYNTHTQTLQMEAAKVSQVNSTATQIGGELTLFNLDAQYTPLGPKQMSLIGTEIYSQVFAATGDTTLFMAVQNNTYHNTAWPQPLYTTQLRGTISQTKARNQGYVSDTTYYYNYSPINGQPQFVLSQNWPIKILLNQTIQNALGLPIQNATFNLPSLPTAAYLDNPANANSLFPSNNAIASSMATYSSYNPVSTSIWRPIESRTQAQLRTGTLPSYLFSGGWLVAQAITQRDSLNHVLESKAIKNIATDGTGEIYSSNFYEGLRSNLVGSVNNAKLANCAILSGENLNVPNLNSNYFDIQKLWSRGNGYFTSGQHHTGRYSILVNDNIGPNITLTLKDVKAQKFGYRVSAWFLADTATPVLTVERHNASGSLVDSYTGIPVNANNYDKGIWQRWEVLIPYNQLIANNLFSSNSVNDYLVVKAGTGNHSGQPNTLAYVDDIVCLPTNANYGLMSYDYRGIQTSSTTTDNTTTYFDLGQRGDVIAVKDEKGKSFLQTGFHNMGEN